MVLPLFLIAVRAPFLIARPNFGVVLTDAAVGAVLGGAAAGLAYSFLGRRFVHRPKWGFVAAGVPCSVAFFLTLGLYGQFVGAPLSDNDLGLGFWMVSSVLLGLPLGWGIRSAIAKDGAA